jgi:ElaB/YqjD/DUF883 family membrane-anchored ribosome-binding protein
MGWGWLNALYGLFSGAAGTVVVIFASSRWLASLLLARYEGTLNQELEKVRSKLQEEQKHIQARIDSSVYVTRAHFETEFNAMKELFGLLSNTRLLLPILRASFRDHPADETKEQRTEKLNADYQKLGDAYNQLLKQVEALSPFITPALYRSIDECTTVINRELFQVRMGDREAHAWYVQGTTNQDDFLKQYKVASDIIRARVASLAVLPAQG